jgi:uroporphyrinogen decarboxylase
MTRVERVRTALAGLPPVDRAPFAFWTAYRNLPPRGDGYVRAVLEAWHRHQPDLLKAPFPEGMETAEYVSALRAIREHLPADDPPVLVATVPGVLAGSDAENGGRTLERLRDAPKTTHARLREIATVVTERARAMVADARCDGVFVAVHLPQAAQLQPERYGDVFGKLEREALCAAAGGGGWCNVAHLHGGPWPDCSVAALIEAAHVVSWSDRACGPALSEMRGRASGRCLMGGVDERKVSGLTPEQVAAEVADALAQTEGGRGLIVAPGCTIPAEMSSANLHALAEAVAGYGLMTAAAAS